MIVQYVLTKSEVDNAHRRLRELRHLTLLSRDGGHLEDNREFYLRAKGFEEALKFLGLRREEGNELLRRTEDVQ